LFRYSGVRPEATFPVQLQLSFAQGKERRGFSIELSDAVIEADFVRRSLDYIPHTVRPARSWDFTDTTRDMLFAKQCRHVLEEVCQKGQKPVVSLDDAGISLVMALSVHKSLMSQMVEKILPINQHD